MNKTLRNVVASGALVLTVAGGGAVAYAQTAPEGGAGPAAGLIERFRERRAEHRGEWTRAMADQLGITVEELRTARQAAHEQVVAELGEFERPDSRPDTPEERDALRAQLQERKDAFDLALADQLGIDVQALRDARVAVVQPKLDAAVAEGKISEERAASIIEAVSTGQLPERPAN